MADDDYIGDDTSASNYTVQPALNVDPPDTFGPQDTPRLVQLPDWAMGALARPDGYNTDAPAWPTVQPQQPSPGQLQALDANPFMRTPGMNDPTTPVEKALYDFVVPQSPLDYALYAMGPMGRLGKAAKMATLAAGIYGDMTDEAQAGKASTLLKGAARMGEILGEKGAAKAAELPAPAQSLFDYSRIHEVPDVPQFDLPRYDPPRGVSERMSDLVSNPQVEQQMLDALERGKSIGQAPFFYNNDPLRQAFIDELGKRRGPTNFAKYMDYVAATSPRSKVEANARNASYYYVRDLQGVPAPNVGDPIAEGYGHMAQRLHQQNINQLMTEGGWDVFKNPKPASFSQNLQGNFMPITADAHAVKLPAMYAQDPRFIATSYKPEEGAKMVYPQKMLAKGKITMPELLNEPTYWASQPRPNEYGAFEQYYKNLGRQAGFDAPAMAQASGWAAGGPMTGLGSIAGDPFIRAVEKRANITAAQRGITPAEALSQMMRGKAPLLSVGGAAVAAPVMGDLARQDQYQPEEY